MNRIFDSITFSAGANVRISGQVSALDLFKMTLQLLQIAKVDLSAGR
jgi:hypothetical protein